MKKIYKIGFLYNPWFLHDWEIQLLHMYIPDIEIEYVNDCYNNYCDLLFYSPYTPDDYYLDGPINFFYNIEFKKIKYDLSNTKFCLVHNEPHGFPRKDYNEYDDYCNFYKLKGNNYAISHFIDSPTNCFMPYLINESEILLSNNYNILHYQQQQKTKFCSIISSTESIHRRKYISLINHYKNVDIYGIISGNEKRLENDEYNTILFESKFNLAIENTHSIQGEAYLTEKIGRSYMHGCIPIYYGSNYVSEIFNEKTFINANKYNDNDLLEYIKEIDINDNLYNEIINTPILKNPNFDYYNYFMTKKYMFIKNILENKI